jgi:hypothetical protein
MDHPHAFLCVMRKNTLKGQYVKKVQMLLAEVEGLRYETANNKGANVPKDIDWLKKIVSLI